MKRWLTAALLVGCAAAHAQDLQPGVRLGIGVDELRQALPATDLVRRPQRLAGGLAGSWRLATAELAGVGGSETFFFAGGVLKRIEFTADAGAFDSIAAWARAAYGPERATQEAPVRYVAWSTPETDIYLRQSGPALQLVFSARPPRDDRAL